jgi:hypothetical protein
MKVIEHYEVPKESLSDFLAEHTEELIKIKSVTPMQVTCTIEQDYTVPELHIKDLALLAQSVELTDEELGSIQYAIDAIKTLEDMEVLK